MNKRILFSGTGGQGVISLGKIVASSALEAVPHITYFPSYGAEVRGGTANCQVTFSDKEIATPVAEVFDMMLLMNQPSFDRFFGQADDNAVVVVNSTICNNIPMDERIIKVDAISIATKLKNPRGANFVMLGALVNLNKKLFDVDKIRQLIKDKFVGKPKVIELNLACFDAWNQSDSI